LNGVVIHKKGEYQTVQDPCDKTFSPIRGNQKYESKVICPND
jgi:hypothetical protein